MFDTVSLAMPKERMPLHADSRKHRPVCGSLCRRQHKLHASHRHQIVPEYAVSNRILCVQSTGQFSKRDISYDHMIYNVTCTIDTPVGTVVQWATPWLIIDTPVAAKHNFI
jgi:hypothetical protein